MDKETKMRVRTTVVSYVAAHFRITQNQIEHFDTFVSAFLNTTAMGSYREGAEIKQAERYFKEFLHDSVPDRSKHDYICGWLDKCREIYCPLPEPPKETGECGVTSILEDMGIVKRFTAPPKECNKCKSIHCVCGARYDDTIGGL